MVYHILADGSVRTTMKGVTVSREQYPEVYRAIERIMETNERRTDESIQRI